MSVVIPVHNEEECVQELFHGLRGTLDCRGKEWEIVFVDDGSTDGTPTRLSGLASRDWRVRIVRHQGKKGLSAALTAGFSHSSGRIIISMDGDLQFDPADIPRLIGALESADVACGWRRWRRDRWDRRCLSFLAYVARYAILGDKSLDSGCTFRAYRRVCVENLVLQQGHHRFLPYLLRERGFRMVDVPITHRKRRHGRSKYGSLRVAEGIATLFYLWRRRWGKRDHSLSP